MLLLAWGGRTVGSDSFSFGQVPAFGGMSAGREPRSKALKPVAVGGGSLGLKCMGSPAEERLMRGVRGICVSCGEKA